MLIGLLLPAVQRMEKPGASDLQLLRGVLPPDGGIGIVMGDGSVRVLLASSFSSAESRSMSFEL